MKYEVEIDINLPKHKVVELFYNVDNMKHWQPDLLSFEHLSGELRQEGAKSKLKYQMGKREVVMIETITVNKLPDEFSGTYEAKGVWNEVQNYFVEVDENSTRWKSVNKFKCSGFMKVMAFLMPGMFKKESCKYLKNFKAFAESK